MFLIDVVGEGEAPLKVPNAALADPVCRPICLVCLGLPVLFCGRKLIIFFRYSVLVQLRLCICIEGVVDIAPVNVLALFVHVFRMASDGQGIVVGEFDADILLLDAGQFTF